MRSPHVPGRVPEHFGEPYSNFDDAEIDFVIQNKHLTDARYNVLT
jgi:hypothetical protein